MGTSSIVDTTGNPLIVGTSTNGWLFNTYPYSTQNTCFLQIRSNAVTGSWSNPLFGLDCYGNVSFTGNLNCNNIQAAGPLSIISSNPALTTISAGYVGENQLISSLPGYDT